MEAVIRGSYDAEADYLKEFVEKRFDVFGEIVINATKESIWEETKGSWRFHREDGDIRSGNGNKKGGNRNNIWEDWRNNINNSKN